MSMVLFFELLKKNAMLYAFVVNGNLATPDTSGYNTFRYTQQAISVRDFWIGDLHIKTAELVNMNTCRLIRLNTNDERVYEKIVFYFDRNSMTRPKAPYSVGGEAVREEFKDLGIFELPYGPVEVSLIKSSSFGYSIDLTIYPASISRASLEHYQYYIKGTRVPQEVMYLFDPEEIQINVHYSPTEYKCNR